MYVCMYTYIYIYIYINMYVYVYIFQICSLIIRRGVCPAPSAVDAIADETLALERLASFPETGPRNPKPDTRNSEDT